MDIERRSLRRAGSLLVAGVIVVVIANINPIVAVYAEPDLLAATAMIARDRNGWVLQHGVFLAGLLLTTGGLSVLGRSLRASSGRRLAQVALAAMIAATGIWVVITALRLSVPVAQIHQAVDIPPLFEAAMSGWLFQSFNLLMLGGLVIYGGALFQSGWPRWLGLTTIVLSSLMLGVFSFFGDGPPEMLCVVTLILGVVALRRSLRREPDLQPVA